MTRRPARRLRALLVWMTLAALAAHTATAATIESSATLDPFGRVDLYRGDRSPTQVVLFLSDADGWNRPDVESARALASLDTLVIGVDVPRYLATMADRAGDELYPFADLEVLSQFVQKRIGLGSYLAPVVIGRGVGATLAYAIAAAARPNEFAAAVSLGFCPDVTLPRPLGAGGGLVIAPGDGVHVYRLQPTTAALAVPWTAVDGGAVASCDPDAARRFADAAPNATRFTLAARERLDEPEDWLPYARGALDRVARAPVPPAPAAGDVADLPLVEVPAVGTPRALAVILSGDGGWASLDREVGDALAAAGVAVVGLNSLAYFWTKRTPDGTAADLARIVRAYRERWRTRVVLLIGYSRGADVVPFLAHRLPADVHDAIALVALLGPARTTDFEFHVTDWLGGTDTSAMPVAPEVAALGALRVLCVHGADEDESLCPILDPVRIHRLTLPGGHHFGGDYDAIASRILAEAQLPSERVPSDAATSLPAAEPSAKGRP